MGAHAQAALKVAYVVICFDFTHISACVCLCDPVFLLSVLYPPVPPPHGLPHTTPAQTIPITLASDIIIMSVSKDLKFPVLYFHCCYKLSYFFFNQAISFGTIFKSVSWHISL